MEERAPIPRHDTAEDIEPDRNLSRNSPGPDAIFQPADGSDVPEVRGQTGPGDNGAAPGELRVSRPNDFHDPWNPRYDSWRRLQGVVRRWIGGGG